MNLLNYSILYFSFFALISCKAPQGNASKNEDISQGIAGRVLWREGNFMPTINGNNENKSLGIEREIMIYELTNLNQVSRNGEFYNDIQTKLIKTANSKADGSFKISLEPGVYSIFTKEEGGLYANIFDGENNIFPITVEPGKVTGLTIIVDYKAAY